MGFEGGEVFIQFVFEGFNSCFKGVGFKEDKYAIWELVDEDGTVICTLVG